MRRLPAAPAELETQLAKARVAGTAAGSIFFPAQRHVAQLHKCRSMMHERSGFSLDAMQPPLHFRRKAAVAAALRLWTAARLATAMAELAEAALQSRRNSDLADTIAERALLAIATPTSAATRRSA